MNHLQALKLYLRSLRAISPQGWAVYEDNAANEIITEFDINDAYGSRFFSRGISRVLCKHTSIATRVILARGPLRVREERMGFTIELPAWIPPPVRTGHWVPVAQYLTLWEVCDGNKSYT